MPKIILFAAIIVTCLAISTGSSADSHSTTSQKKNAANHQRREIITIQVGSHKKADDANRVKSRLISRGLDAVVDFEQVKDKGMWYRVYIGQFETREAANIFAKDLVQQGIIAGYWVKKKKVTTEALNKEKERQSAAVATATIIQTPDDKTTVTPSETSSPPSQSSIAEENAANHQRLEIITIQVGSHKKADDANRVKSRLISRGLDAVVDFEQVKDKGMWYRVYIGQFETREAANIFAKDLVQQGIIAGYWVKKKKVTLEAVKTEKKPQGESVKTNAKIETPDDKTTVAPSETSSPPSQSSIAEEAGSSQSSLTKETQPPEAEDQVIEYDEPKETPAALQVDADISKQDQSRLSLGVKASVLASHKTGDFTVTKSDNGATESWSFGDTYLFLGIVGNYRLNDTFTIESSLEKDVTENIDNWLLSVAVTYQLQPINWFAPYLRGGGIIGRLHWDDLPGDFDTGIGLEGGLGMHLTKSKFRLGLEASYRYLKYNYNTPAANDITFSNDHLNMSGLVFSGTLSYLF